MRRNTKEIVKKLIDKKEEKNVKNTLDTSKSTNKSTFSFKNSTNTTKYSFKSNSFKKEVSENMDKKFFEKIFEILKMRIYIEMLTGIKDEEIKEIINENIRLINFKEYDIKSINKFVDDLVDIIKEENKKKKINTKLVDKKDLKEFNESIEINLNFPRRSTIQLNSCGYRPASVITQRRKTVEIFLDKPKGPEQKYQMKFNMFEKSIKKNYSFYEGDPYNSNNNRKYDSEGIEEMKNQLIDDLEKDR